MSSSSSYPPEVTNPAMPEVMERTEKVRTDLDDAIDLLSGYGDGDGSGYGSGDGSGYGDGDGSGYG